MAEPTILAETRGRTGLLTLNRPQALNALNAAVIGELLAALDRLWASMMAKKVYVTGGLGVFWLIAWWWLYENPETHPRLSAAEREYIRAGQPQVAEEKPTATPAKDDSKAV